MKKTFGLAVAIIFLLAAAIVGWGAWLNYSDENQIANRMNNRAVEVNAVRAARRELTPVIPLDAVRFSSDTITDAVALTAGTIILFHSGEYPKIPDSGSPCYNPSARAAPVSPW